MFLIKDSLRWEFVLDYQMLLVISSKHKVKDVFLSFLSDHLIMNSLSLTDTDSKSLIILFVYNLLGRYKHVDFNEELLILQIL